MEYVQEKYRFSVMYLYNADSEASVYGHILMFFINSASEENRNKFYAQVLLIIWPAIPACLWLKFFPGDVGVGVSVLNPGYILENWDVWCGKLNSKIILKTWYIYYLWIPSPWAWAETANGISLPWLSY